MTYHLAQLNVATAKGPMDSEVMAGFADALDEVNALAEASDGFVWRLKDETGNATDLRMPGDDTTLINLSVWESVESLRAYAFNGLHNSYLRRRREWFERSSQAYLVLWWVPAGHEPSLAEAEEKLEHLRANGPTPDAFNWRKRFDPPG